MKKYLNKSLFYQGDSNILLPLFIVYVATFILINLTANEFFGYNIRRYMYNHAMAGYIFSFQSFLTLIIYIGVIYAITVGIFKRKKWSTLLSGPFSRKDIRIRELIIIIMSIFIYIFMFLAIIGKNYIQYYDIIKYMDYFYRIVILDIIRIISISIITLGVLLILDTIFSNLYYLFGSIIFLFIYILLFMENYSLILNCYVNGKTYGVSYIYNLLMEYLDRYNMGVEVSVLKVIYISIAFIVVGITLILISKKLTNKILVENMNEGIIFDFPKKLGSFLIATFVGLAVSAFISNIINDIYFRYSLERYNLVLLRTVIFFTVSIISVFIFRNLKKRKKDIYY